jgi:AcrR family transcriptional regulator
MVARGAARERAILTATVDVIAEVGYDAMTMDAVAARASASKTTIYRRWRNKPELVKAALDLMDAESNATAPDTGTLRGDLVGTMEVLRSKASPTYLALIGGLVSAARFDAALADALQAHTSDEEISPFAAGVERAVRRGDVPGDVDTVLVHEVAEAMIMRQLNTGKGLDDDFIARVVDGVLLPLLRHRS